MTKLTEILERLYKRMGIKRVDISVDWVKEYKRQRLEAIEEIMNDRPNS